jgi:hypothetical protein
VVLGYWIGVAGAAKGSAGAALVVFCQIVPAVFTANERLPVVPNVVGIEVE